MENNNASTVATNVKKLPVVEMDAPTSVTISTVSTKFFTPAATKVVIDEHKATNVVSDTI